MGLSNNISLVAVLQFQSHLLIFLSQSTSCDLQNPVTVNFKDHLYLWKLIWYLQRNAVNTNLVDVWIAGALAFSLKNTHFEVGLVDESRCENSAAHRIWNDTLLLHDYTEPTI